MLQSFLDDFSARFIGNGRWCGRRLAVLLCLSAALMSPMAAQAGQLAPGARTICRESGRYIGWPSLARTADGALLAVFSGNRFSHVCPSGVVQVVSSTDCGRTWSAPQTIGDTPVDDRDASVHVLPDGEILVTWFNSVSCYTDSYWIRAYEKERPFDINALLPLCGRWCVRSRDGGKTWTPPSRMPIVGSAPHGGIVLKDGALLAVGSYTPGVRDDGSAPRNLPTAICCERSTDGGRSWTMLCERLPDVDGEGLKPRAFHEPHVAELPDGTLVALVRYHGGDECFRRSASKDGGRNWSPMKKISLKAGLTAPHLLALLDGRLVCTYGLRNDKTKLAVGEYASVSSDAGLTWTPVDGICLWKSAAGVGQYDMGYPATVLLADGSLYTVFYEPERKGDKPCLMGVRWRLLEDGRTAKIME